MERGVALRLPYVQFLLESRTDSLQIVERVFHAYVEPDDVLVQSEHHIVFLGSTRVRMIVLATPHGINAVARLSFTAVNDSR